MLGLLLLYTDPSVPRQIEKEARALKYISTADIWFGGLVIKKPYHVLARVFLEDVYDVYCWGKYC